MADKPDIFNKSRGKPKFRVINPWLLPDGQLTEADLDLASGQGMAVSGTGHVYKLADAEAEPAPGQAKRTHESLEHMTVAEWVEKNVELDRARGLR